MPQPYPQLPDGALYPSPDTYPAGLFEPVVPDMRGAGPPVGLTVIVRSPDGHEAVWSDQAPQAADRPQGLAISSRAGHGFHTLDVTLHRPVDRDFNDVALLNEVMVVGVDGDVAWEGRVTAAPRSSGADGEQISVQATGWMSHATDRKLRVIYVDRDLGRWGPNSRARQINMLASGHHYTAPQTVPDEQSGLPALVTRFEGTWTVNYEMWSEGMYDAGAGNTIGTVYYDVSTHNVGTNPQWRMEVESNWQDDKGGANHSTSQLLGVSTSGYWTQVQDGTTRRYAWVYMAYVDESTGGGTAGQQYAAYWRRLTVYGDHGLTLAGDTDPKGVLASDVIEHAFGEAAPLIDTSGVQATTLSIPHLAFHDGAEPYEILERVNAYHLWAFGVWEGRRLSFGPHDLTEPADWQVAHTDRGVSIELSGDTVEDVANGIVIQFDDVTAGTSRVVTPADEPSLSDQNPENPWNRAGVDRWIDLQLSTPTTRAVALELGRARLAEANRPKRAGTIRLGPLVRDSGGALRPSWMVRANDTISVVSGMDLSDRPRLIHEVSWRDGGAQVSVDGPPRSMDALFDRLSTALEAEGIS